MASGSRFLNGGHMTNTLFEISTELVNLLDDIEESGGEIVDDKLEALEIMLSNKTRSCIDFINYKDMMIKRAKQKKKELDDYIKSQQNALDNFENYCMLCMDRLGVSKIESDLYKLSIPKVRKVVSITDQDKLPARYKTVVQEVKVSKVELAKALKVGEVDGACLVDSPNRSLKIGIKK